MTPAVGARCGRRDLRSGHYVRSADGTFYRVQYVHETRGEAELVACSEDGDSDFTQRATLPLAELRRVADPRNKRPRVEGMPAERPRCEWCDRPLRPVVVNHHSGEAELWKRRIVRRTFSGWSAYEGVFHNQSCAIRFAGAAFRAGYRRTR